MQVVLICFILLEFRDLQSPLATPINFWDLEALAKAQTFRPAARLLSPLSKGWHVATLPHEKTGFSSLVREASRLQEGARVTAAFSEANKHGYAWFQMTHVHLDAQPSESEYETFRRRTAACRWFANYGLLEQYPRLVLAMVYSCMDPPRAKVLPPPPVVGNPLVAVEDPLCRAAQKRAAARAKKSGALGKKEARNDGEPAESPPLEPEELYVALGRYLARNSIGPSNKEEPYNFKLSLTRMDTLPTGGGHGRVPQFVAYIVDRSVGYLQKEKGVTAIDEMGLAASPAYAAGRADLLFAVDIEAVQRDNYVVGQHMRFSFGDRYVLILDATVPRLLHFGFRLD